MASYYCLPRSLEPVRRRDAGGPSPPLRRGRTHNFYATNRRACAALMIPFLTPPQPDRGAEFIAAIVARPVMVDAAAGVETGFLGDKQHAVATRAFRPAKILGRKDPSR